VVVPAGTRHDGGVTTPTSSDDQLAGDESDATDVEPRPRRRVDKTLLFVSFGVAVGIMLIIRGVLVGVTGDSRSNLPEQIERVDPVPEAVRVLAQTSVFVDLAPGYTGRLVIDDVEIETVGIDEINEVAEPGQQIVLPPVTIYEPGNATLTFTPAAGAPIEQFDEGLHEATVIFWPIEEGESRARSYRWTFNTV
jgi:hypothetical protein